MKDAAPRTRRKDKDKDKERQCKGDNNKQKKAKKPRLRALDEVASQREAHNEDDRVDDDMERGFSQEQILQLRALDSGDDDDENNSDTGVLSTGRFRGHGGSAAQIKFYVENQVSGEFFRLRRPLPRANRSVLVRSKTSLRRQSHRRQRHKALVGSDSDSDSGITRSSLCDWRGLRGIDTVLAIMGHGILAGLSWMDAFNLGASYDRFLRDEASRRRFTCTYSGVADRSRQLFFLLSKYPSLFL